ncbi:LptF/LptG family permease [Rhabdochlamydiaceae symbiont of Dictyostelium giganteum]|uniref:LptF/LptG family permease n=1 Tax=Rhabdochlamydiaceae symbiont of Dictyostelium giganteum TaxID=3342349 RepID=UPI00384FD163
MPILWRFLLKNYFQAFCLSLVSFIAAVFVMRFKDIAEFAAMSSDPWSITLFGLYQLPYILPLIIPIASVIAATLLFQKLSDYHELHALRACGFSLRQLLAPILLGASFLSLVSFIVVGEIGPRSRLWSKQLTYHVTSSNPFAILNKMTETKLSNAYMDVGLMRGGKEGKDVLFVFTHPSSKRLSVMTAKKLQLSKDQLIGERISIISSAPSSKVEGFDHLVIENEAKMTTKANALSHLFQDQEWSHKPEYLPLKTLLIGISLEEDHPWTNPYTLELVRRCALALTPVAFSLLGAAFGMQVGRVPSQKGLMWTILLVIFNLSAFTSAKNLKNMPLATWLCYVIPLSLLVVFSLRSLTRISQGET